MIISEGKLFRLSTPSTETEAEEDPSRLHAVGPNLGGYTQWVRWRAPTGKKLPQAQSSTPTRKKTLRMTLRVTRRLGGYCRGNIPPVGSSRGNNLRKHRAPIAPSARRLPTAPL